MLEVERELEAELEDLMSVLREADLESERQQEIPDTNRKPGSLGGSSAVLPVIQLHRANISTASTPFSATPSGFEAFVCAPFSSPQTMVKITGQVFIDDKGIRRPLSASDRQKWPRVVIITQAYTQSGVSVSHNPISSVGPDGSFTTESMLVLVPGTRRIRLRTTLELGSAGVVSVESTLEYNPLECFLEFMESWENMKSWQNLRPQAPNSTCREAATPLEFLSSTRKMFQPTTNKDGTGPPPGWQQMFDLFLTRNKDICPLFPFKSPEARSIWRFERLEIDGRVVNIGHVLAGIEGGRKQKPGSTYPYLFSVKDGNTEATLTWAGDLGKPLELYAESKVTGKPADLNSLLAQSAGADNLLGDIDGINMAALYDENKGLAENFHAYYRATPFRRFHNFLAYALDDSGAQRFRLASTKPPNIDQLSRDNAGVRIAFFARVLKEYKKGKGLLKLTADQESQLDTILTYSSSEATAVTNYFVSFIEAGLAKEP